MLAKRLNCNCLGWQLSINTGHLVFMCLAVGLCLLLALWQWQRAEDARTRYQDFQTRMAEPSVALSNTPFQDFQKVTASGHLQRLFLLDNQIHHGVVGWHVIASMDTEYGPVLVNLGWQSASVSAPVLTDFPDPIAVSGLVKHPEPGLMLAEAEADPVWPNIMQQIDIPLLKRTLGTELAPFMIFASQSYADLTPIQPKPENKYPMHIGYAVQWILIGLAGLIAFLFANRREQDE